MTPKLAQLLRDNATRPRNYAVKANDDESTIYVYDVIGFDFWTGGGITAAKFVEDLNAIKSDKISVRFNSPGGDVFEARTMVSAMRAARAKGKTITAYVDGLAASAASFMAVNADELHIADGGFLMVHNAWTLAMGDRNDMLNMASLLEKIDGTIADDYERKSGAKREDVTGWMDAETWFTASEAKSAGLADSVIEAPKVKAQAWNLGAYQHAPEAKDEGDQYETARAQRERHFSLLALSPQ